CANVTVLPLGNPSRIRHAVWPYWVASSAGSSASADPTHSRQARIAASYLELDADKERPPDQIVIEDVVAAEEVGPVRKLVREVGAAQAERHAAERSLREVERALDVHVDARVEVPHVADLVRRRGRRVVRVAADIAAGEPHVPCRIGRPGERSDAFPPRREDAVLARAREAVG